MLFTALAFLAGVCTLQCCAELPPLYSYILAVFALFNRMDFLRAAQGVVISTLLYGMLIIYLKLF